MEAEVGELALERGELAVPEIRRQRRREPTRRAGDHDLTRVPPNHLGAQLDEHRVQLDDKLGWLVACETI